MPQSHESMLWEGQDRSLWMRFGYRSQNNTGELVEQRTPAGRATGGRFLVIDDRRYPLTGLSVDGVCSTTPLSVPAG